jgi:hypothetical protein
MPPRPKGSTALRASTHFCLAGTSRTSRGVHFSVAIGAKADISQAQPSRPSTQRSCFQLLSQPIDIAERAEAGLEKRRYIEPLRAPYQISESGAAEKTSPQRENFGS